MHPARCGLGVARRGGDSLGAERAQLVSLLEELHETRAESARWHAQGQLTSPASLPHLLRGAHPARATLPLAVLCWVATVGTWLASAALSGEWVAIWSSYSVVLVLVLPALRIEFTTRR